jgi:hypothetical protein
MSTEDKRAKALSDYRKKLLEHREIEAKLKDCNVSRHLNRSPSSVTLFGKELRQN